MKRLLAYVVLLGLLMVVHAWAANLPATRTNLKDGTKLILIPAGQFLAEGYRAGEKKFSVKLPAHYMAETEVTNAQ